jgi:hypothetical protein
MKFFFLVCALAVTTPWSYAADPSVDEKIKTIRAHYSEIEGSLKNCRQVKSDLPEESTEGGELTAYLKNSSVRKLSARFFGEMGRTLQEYYFWDNQLIFVLRVESRYTKILSGEVKSKTEERFYFAEGKLIRWLNGANKDMTDAPEKAGREGELFASAKKYSAMVAR